MWTDVKQRSIYNSALDYELMDNRHASLLIVSINYLWAEKGCKKYGGASNRKPKMEYGDLHFFIAARLSNNTNKFSRPRWNCCHFSTISFQLSLIFVA